jgi:hypothetical protein
MLANKVHLQLCKHVFECTQCNQAANGITRTKRILLAVAAYGYRQQVICAARTDYNDSICQMPHFTR